MPLLDHLGDCCLLGAVPLAMKVAPRHASQRQWDLTGASSMFPKGMLFVFMMPMRPGR